jgi:tetratricopeptide (TPR) repeat protein
LQLCVPQVAIMAASYPYLSLSHPEHGTALARALLASAVTAADRQAQGWALLGLARFQNHTGDLRAAAAAAAQALALFRSPGDAAGRAERMGEADALCLLGHTRYLTDDNEDAARCLDEAIALYHDLGESLGEATALGHLGFVQYLTDEYEDAAASLERAVRTFAANGDERAESNALAALSMVRLETGDYAGAVAGLRRALVAADPAAEAWIRSRLGLALCVMGQPAEAETVLAVAVEQHREGRNPFGEATSVNYLGRAQRMNGDAEAAVASQQRAVELYRECGSRLGEGNAWQELGMARHAAGDAADALQAEELALEIFRDVGQPVSQAETLNNIGDLRLTGARTDRESGTDSGGPIGAEPDQDRIRAARASYEQALALLGDLPVPGEQARAFEGIGRCLLLGGRRQEAAGWLRQALAIHLRLGAPDADRVAVLLAGDTPPA